MKSFTDVVKQLHAQAEPKVSIITMLHDGRTHLLKRVVQSVLEQTYKNWELILQDDCSSDGTFEMAVGFALLNKQVKVFRNKTNLGIVKNRAAAFKNTTGELICHLDNDDFLYPHALDAMVKAFKSHPEIGLAYSDMAYVDKNGEATSYQTNKNYGAPITDYGWRHFGMYRRSAYEQTNGYNEALTNPCEDGDLFMQLAEKFPFKRVPQVLYAFQNDGEHASLKVPPCSDCASRSICNYLRVWTGGLTAPEHKEHWQNIIASNRLEE